MPNPLPKPLPHALTLIAAFRCEGSKVLNRHTRGKARAGEEAGYVDASGYRTVKLDGQAYKVHRIVYKMHHGTCPEFLDHINGDKLDNRIENLRPATKSQNAINQVLPRNKSGYRGVSWHRGDQRWHGELYEQGTRHYLGSYSTAIEAAEVYDLAAIKYHGEFATLNFPKE